MGRIARALMRFEGWALDGSGAPERVELVVNDAASVMARLGVNRPDVPANLQEPDATPACGWAVTMDLAPFSPGPLNVKAVAVRESGVRTTFAEHSYDLVDDIITPSAPPARTPLWVWGLPDFLGETPVEVNRVISPAERMTAGDDDMYLAIGLSALKAIRLAQVASGKEGFASILDMPCGHGRVLRWLKAAYPGAQITACDLLAEGVDFCAEALGAAPVYSTPMPTAALFPGTYDLIFVGSLLTHVDVHQWDHLIDLWHSLLAPDGLLVVTTHGELVAERMRAGHRYGYAAPALTRMLRTYEHSGFAFLEERPDNVDYGITIARADWTLSRLLRQPDFRVALSCEALWACHQDVTAVVKRPLTPS
jgi:SAM-dependent methyltransferase